MKLIIAMLAIAAGALAQTQIPANGTSVQSTLSNVNPSGSCVASQQVYVYPTGQLWGCVGQPGSLAWGKVDGETTGMKLRRVERVASASNPLKDAPWIAPSAWQASTAYTQGNMVSNGGNLYVAEVSGTSAASGGPTGQGAGTITDGSVTWVYAGAPYSSDANAPTYTDGSTTTLTTLYKWYDHPELFGFRGGFPIAYSSTFAGMYNGSTCNCASVTPGGGTLQGLANRGVQVVFQSDAPKLSIKHYEPNGFRIIVDGRYLSLAGGTQTNAGTGYSTIDWGGVRKWRTYMVETTTGATFYGVYTDAQSLVLPPNSANRVKVAWIGDSFSAGANGLPAVANDTIPGRVAKMLGWSDVFNISEGGTGYLATNNGTKYTFGQRLASIVAAQPDMVVYLGSVNDSQGNGFSSAQLTPAALATWQALRAALPTTPVIAIGVTQGTSFDSSPGVFNYTNVDYALQTAFNQWGDTNAYYIPVAGDPLGMWITGTGKVTSTTGTGNADVYVSSDGVHPTYQGLNYWSTRIASSIRAVIAQIP